VFGDTHGDYVYLFERDCSVQRRHQKVLEEAPAPGMTVERRAAMGKAAVEAAKAVGYVGAGTVEFIVNQDGSFYFMEMNTRLQVEHPVTEMITGLDLVEWQLRVASGERLPLAQEQLQIHGHALEARIYAEDPAKGFLPSTGKLVYLAPPVESLHVRVDTGVEEGDAITPCYDPMIAKLIVWARSRDRALARLLQALADFHIVGVANNVGFLSRLVACPAFSTANLDTGLIEREHEYLFLAEETVPDTVWLVAAVAQLLRESEVAERRAERHPDRHSPWHTRDGWRLNAEARRDLLFRCQDVARTVQVGYRADGYTLSLDDGRARAVRGELNPHGLLRVEIDGTRMDATVIAVGEKRHVFVNGRAWQLASINPLHHAGDGGGAEGGLLAPMPGKIIALVAKEGEKVEKGAPLLILEAMKMEHTIVAPAGGTVKSFRFAVGEQVADGAELVEFDAIQV
jgi:3-methylcrotonyl-CoA carboxylase alpha subunit